MSSGFGFAAELGLQETDRIRLAEAFRLSDEMGDSIWKGWNDVPFAVLLVTPGHEYLVRHPQPSAEFVKLGHDELLKSDIYWRPRQFPVNLLAAFPAVSGISTAVVGQAQYTETPNSTEWVIALLHEHFHQMQSTQPDYYEGVDRLEIAPSDKTGKWMLEFPFPYSAPPVVERVARLAQALRTKGMTAQDYAALRRDLQRVLPQPAARYFGFQLWQEGIARYVQIRFAEQAASHYHPTAAFSALPDFQSFASCAQALVQRRARYLDNPDLAAAKRLLFYEIGAAEGLLLDRTVPGWKNRYFSQPFDTEPYFVAHGI